MPVFKLTFIREIFCLNPLLLSGGWLNDAELVNNFLHVWSLLDSSNSILTSPFLRIINYRRGLTSFLMGSRGVEGENLGHTPC